jgi:hypothetical protein
MFQTARAKTILVNWNTGVSSSAVNLSTSGEALVITTSISDQVSNAL